MTGASDRFTFEAGVSGDSLTSEFLSLLTELSDRSCEAERAMASCVLAIPKPEVIQAVSPEKFADGLCREIVSTAAALLAHGEHVDCITVTTAIARRHRDWGYRVFDVYQQPGWFQFNWKAYARLVEEGYLRRQAAAIGWDIIQAARSADTETLLSRLAVTKAVGS